MTELVVAYYKKHTRLWENFLKALVLVLGVAAAGALAAAGTQLAVSSQKEISARVVNGENAKPKEKIIIVFSEPVSSSSIEEGFSISPEEKVSFLWTQGNQELDLKPASHFKPGEKYNIDIKAKEGIFKNKERKISLSFQTEDYPKVMKVEPGKEATDIGIKSDFKVSFDKPTRDYDVNFEINPFHDFDYEVSDDHTEFRIFPKDKLEYDTEYKMKITAKVAGSKGADSSKEVFSRSFKTEKKPYVAPARDTSAVIPEDQVADRDARISEGKYVDINLAKQHLSIFKDGERIGTYRISSGKRGMATPTGNFKILSKRSRAWSSKYGLYMPYWMQFTGAGHGIHELPEWPGGYKEGAAHLGIPVSHGCVRLGIGPAETVYAFSDVGTPVVIHY